MSKYSVLVNILDKVRSEAPKEYKSYYPLDSENEKLNQARAKAFIHLYLKVKFGILEFLEREEYITDGSNDGGIDAFFIDEVNRTIWFVQSKFRTTERNFEQKGIAVDELLAMDVDRIADGETSDESGNEYNSKIQRMIGRIQSIEDIGRYKYEVVILANVRKYKASSIRKIIGGFPHTVFDFDKCYEELVFPVVSGTYYDAEDLFININLAEKEYSRSRISYPVETDLTGCEITILFVPTLEIAKILYKYKNSILKYNPRSYLALRTNVVNKEIAKSITEKSTNEFSLFNNGITMLSDETNLQENVGRKSRGQLYVRNPQIINGGQTAYTLSSIYEQNLRDGEDSEGIFETKEVMLKVITFTDIEDTSSEQVLALIQAISKATNQQTPIKEADRRANDKIQIELQQSIFQQFGYFYERKKGEFYDGLQNHYIDKTKVIDRVAFMRTSFAMQGFPARAVISERALFNEERFKSILDGVENSLDMFFSYMCYVSLTGLRKKYRSEINNRYGVAQFGNAIRHGTYAIIYAAYRLNETEITPGNVFTLSEGMVNSVLEQWLEFEKYAISQSHNKSYFSSQIDPDTGREILEHNFDGYYKGGTLNRDITTFFDASK